MMKPEPRPSTAPTPDTDRTVRTPLGRDDGPCGGCSPRRRCRGSRRPCCWRDRDGARHRTPHRGARPAASRRSPSRPATGRVGGDGLPGGARRTPRREPAHGLGGRPHRAPADRHGAPTPAAWATCRLAHPAEAARGPIASAAPEHRRGARRRHPGRPGLRRAATLPRRLDHHRPGHPRRPRPRPRGPRPPRLGGPDERRAVVTA